MTLVTKFAIVESFMPMTLFFLFSLLRYAESVGAKHYHTSAKQNKGIEELFLDLCKSTYTHVSTFKSGFKTVTNVSIQE